MVNSPARRTRKRTSAAVSSIDCQAARAAALGGLCCRRLRIAVQLKAIELCRAKASLYFVDVFLRRMRAGAHAHEIVQLVNRLDGVSPTVATSRHSVYTDYDRIFSYESGTVCRHVEISRDRVYDDNIETATSSGVTARLSNGRG